MVELLYSSGLRVAELTGLDVQASPQARGWIDWQDAQAHVLAAGMLAFSFVVLLVLALMNRRQRQVV